MPKLTFLRPPFFAITINPQIMPLCTICDKLNPLAGVYSEEERSAPDRERLGPYEELSSRADAGCEGCDFFRKTITESSSWSHRLDKLEGHIVFLDTKRLDVRPQADEGGHSYALDDLMFDICSAEGVASKLICKR